MSLVCSRAAPSHTPTLFSPPHCQPLFLNPMEYTIPCSKVAGLPDLSFNLQVRGGEREGGGRPASPTCPSTFG